MSLMLNPLAVPSQMVLTPSGQDGIPWDLEEELRMYGAQLIQHAGSLLELPQVAMATAQVLFQRFWFVTSLKYFSVRSICMGALFLSSKLEETPLGLRNLINVFDFLLQRAEHASSLSPSPRSLELELPRIDEALRRAKQRAERGEAAPPKEFEYQPHSYHAASFHDTKDALVIAEMQLLKRLGFQTETQLPYAIMVNYLQLIGWSDKRMWMEEGGEGTDVQLVEERDEATRLVGRIARRARRTLQGKGRGVAQVAWGFLNDSLQTPLPALFPPHVLATASIYLCTLLDPSLPALPTPRPDRKRPNGGGQAASTNGEAMEEHKEGEADDDDDDDEEGGSQEDQDERTAWYHLFDVTRSELRIVCSWILRLYSTSGAPSASSSGDAGAGPRAGTERAGQGLAGRVREEHGGMVEFLDKERVRRWLEVRQRRAREAEEKREKEREP